MTIQDLVAVVSVSTPIIIAVLSVLSARRAETKADKAVAEVEETKTTAKSAETKATENKTVLDSNTAMLEIMSQQNENQSRSIQIQAELLDNQRSESAKQAAERQGWQTSVDRMASAVDTMTQALTANNLIGKVIQDGVASLPKTIEDTQKMAVEEVKKHMDEKLDPIDEDLKQRLDAIDHKIDNLHQLIVTRLIPPDTVAPADSPMSAVPVGDPPKES